MRALETVMNRRFRHGVLVALSGLFLGSSASYGDIGDTSVCTWQGDRLAAFTPTYDDMPQSSWESLRQGFAPTHARYRLKGSIALVTKARSPDGSGWTDMKAILDQGWLEPMSHGETHPSLPELPVDEIRTQYRGSIDDIVQNTGHPVYSLAYPFGDYDDKSVAEAARFFASARAFDNERNPPSMTNYYTVHSLAIYSDTTSTQIDGMFRDAIENHEWLVTTLHSLQTYNDGWEPVPQDLYDYQMRMAADLVATGVIWNADYTTVAKYIRQRNAARLSTLAVGPDAMTYRLQSDDQAPQDLPVPLTLKTEVPTTWTDAFVQRGATKAIAKLRREAGRQYALFDLLPSDEPFVVKALGANLLQNVQGQTCLDVKEQSVRAGGITHGWDCFGGSSQRWLVIDRGDGYFRIQNQHSRMCLDVAGASLDDDAQAIQWPCHDDDNQRWSIEQESDHVRLVAKHSGKCLELSGGNGANGTLVVQRTCEAGSHQQWMVRD
jgi:hypothetical protein